MSRILTLIETGVFNSEENISSLFKDSTTANPIESDMRTIITHWGYSTGRDMKVRRGHNVSIANSNYRGYTPAQVPSTNGIEKQFS